jgi:hypothetical protein
MTIPWGSISTIAQSLETIAAALELVGNASVYAYLVNPAMPNAAFSMTRVHRETGAVEYLQLEVTQVSDADLTTYVWTPLLMVTGA